MIRDRLIDLDDAAARMVQRATQSTGAELAGRGRLFAEHWTSVLLAALVVLGIAIIMLLQRQA